MQALNGALDPGPGTVVLVVLAPSALPFAYVAVVLHNFYSAYPLDHLEAELGFYPEPDGRPVLDRQRLPVHLVGEDRLGMVHQLEVYGPVEVSGTFGFRFGLRYVLEGAEDEVAGLRLRLAQLYN